MAAPKPVEDGQVRLLIVGARVPDPVSIRYFRKPARAHMFPGRATGLT